MSYEMKEANQVQIEMMKQFIGTCSNLIDALCDYHADFDLQMTVARLKEAMFWFNSFVMNGGDKKKIAREAPMQAASETIN